MSHCKSILNHMRLHGPISDADARNLYGCTRLAARISDLRKQGYAISSRMVNGKNRNGDPTHYAVYSLIEEAQADG